MTNVNMNRAQRRKHAAEMRAAMNNFPTMIHEDNYKIVDCVLCGKTMSHIHDTHAAYPLKPYQTAKQANADGNTGRCCSACNESVTFARIGLGSVAGNPFAESLKNATWVKGVE